jgi:hypothetical protein
MINYIYKIFLDLEFYLTFKFSFIGISLPLINVEIAIILKSKQDYKHNKRLRRLLIAIIYIFEFQL